MPLISQCGLRLSNSETLCDSRLVSVRYTESAYANFSADATNREDGNNVEAVELDFSNVYCRGCGRKRTITELDGHLIENCGEVPELEKGPGKDEEDQ